MHTVLKREMKSVLSYPTIISSIVSHKKPVFGRLSFQFCHKILLVEEAIKNSHKTKTYVDYFKVQKVIVKGGLKLGAQV